MTRLYSKNTSFCHQKHSWRCLDFLSNLSGFLLAMNTAEKSEFSPRCSTHGRKSAKVLLKPSGSVASNVAGYVLRCPSKFKTEPKPHSVVTRGDFLNVSYI